MLPIPGTGPGTSEHKAGPHVTCKTSRIRNFYVWSDALGRYGEPMGNKTAGVTYENIVVISRIHEWKIFRKDEKPTPWSTVITNAWRFLKLNIGVLSITIRTKLKQSKN